MSDGSDIKIVHSSLQEGASHMQAAAQAVEARLAAFDQETAPLRNGGEWEGDAAIAYNTAKAKWTQQMTELKQIIHSAGGSVDQAQVDFKGADSKGASYFDFA